MDFFFLVFGVGERSFLFVSFHVQPSQRMHVTIDIDMCFSGFGFGLFYCIWVGSI